MQKFSAKKYNIQFYKLVKAFDFSEKVFGFWKTIELYIIFGMKFCISILVLSNNQIKQIKQNFMLTKRATSMMIKNCRKTLV